LRKVNCFKTSFVLVILLSALISGCGQNGEVMSTDKINPIANSDITEMVIEHYKDGKSSNNINIADKDVINQVTANLTSISVTKLSVDQEKSIMDNGNKLSLESTYIVHLRNKPGDTKTAFAILSDHELMLFDVKTMLGNTRTVSYLNAGDEKTLKSIKEIYTLVKQKASIAIMKPK
jgi:hypothetical protein